MWAVRDVLPVGQITMMPQNSIMIIKPYRWEGLWVFDDAQAELVKEPPFPGADLHLHPVREELGGNIYLWQDADQEG